MTSVVWLSFLIGFSTILSIEALRCYQGINRGRQTNVISCPDVANCIIIEYEDQKVNSSQVDCDTTDSCGRHDGINTNYLLKCCSIDLCNSPFINESTVTDFPPLTTPIPDYPTLLTTPSSSSCTCHLTA
ncbi:hypothetical protein M3Y95_00257800 [Aphelenchoides besseyi]|nr:hypothetical protein M3Y95_00257800 [Aphelenchoides besseyi]